MLLELDLFLLTILTMLSSTEYLDTHLRPLIESIDVKNSESYTLDALGINMVSSQAILIAIGNRFEKFWNKVVTDSTATKNELPFNYGTDKIKVNGKNRQVDHFFTVGRRNIYLESKCNLTFDTEKKPESNEKIEQVRCALSEVFGKTDAGYYVPVLSDIPEELQNQYRSAGVPVYGVSDMFDWLDNQVPFTIEEYFGYIKNILGPIVRDKLSGRTHSKVSHGVTQKDMDLL